MSDRAGNSVLFQSAVERDQWGVQSKIWGVYFKGQTETGCLLLVATTWSVQRDGCALWWKISFNNYQILRYLMSDMPYKIMVIKRKKYGK